MANKKKKYCVEGVQFNDDIKAYALEIDAAMNRLHEDGYEVQVIEQEGGRAMLVVGRLIEDQPNPMARMLQAITRGMPADDEHLKHMSARTRALTTRFIRACPQDEPKSFGIEARKVAHELVAGYALGELGTAVAELKKEAEEHEKDHKPDSTCQLANVLRELAAVLEETVRVQLQ